MRIHLIDGTYELFRCYFGAPPARNAAGREVGATRGLLRSLASWLRTGQVTHAACAFDHVIESFRNDLFDGYKTGEGIDPDLFSQFELAERAVQALGVTVWPMIEFEADDALAAGAMLYSKGEAVEQVLICSVDKDLAQCVDAQRVVLHDRHKNVTLDSEGVIQKFGVPPHAIPEYLALTGDTADGIPGVPRWGAKSASTVLAHYHRIDNIPADPKQWTVKVRGADGLAESLNVNRKVAKLYRQLATLRTDVPLKETISDIEWRGADRSLLESVCAEVGERDLIDRITRWKS